jgi:hypothetical protein
MLFERIESSSPPNRVGKRDASNERIGAMAERPA